MDGRYRLVQLAIFGGLVSAGLGAQTATESESTQARYSVALGIGSATARGGLAGSSSGRAASVQLGAGADLGRGFRLTGEAIVNEMNFTLQPGPYISSMAAADNTRVVTFGPTLYWLPPNPSRWKPYVLVSGGVYSASNTRAIDTAGFCEDRLWPGSPTYNPGYCLADFRGDPPESTAAGVSTGGGFEVQLGSSRRFAPYAEVRCNWMFGDASRSFSAWFVGIRCRF